MALLAAAAVVVAVLLVSGRWTAVVTSGVSMEPLYHQGDLVLVQHQSGYRPGDIVAYRASGARALVLHRIIGGDPVAGWTMKGDNNQSVDPFHPGTADVAGRAVLHLPGVGRWLRTLTNPFVLAFAAVLVPLLGGAGIRRGRRSARRRRRSAMSHHLDQGAPRRRPVALTALPRPLQAVLAAVGVVVAAGLALGGYAFFVPATAPAADPSTHRSLTVGYSATVPRTAAYDGTTVTAPEPVFRRITDDVTLQLAYTGPAGTLRVDVGLATDNGWHTTLRLAGPARTAGTGDTVEIPVDLAGWQDRAQAAAAAIGIPAGTVDVTLSPRVEVPGAAAFAPSMPFRLTALQFAPAGEAASTATDVQPGAVTTVPRTVDLAVLRPTVDQARLIAVLVVVAGAVAAAGCAALAGRVTAADPAQVIRRRWSRLLAEVSPMAAPADRHTVDVTEFPTIAALAQRYGLMVLHWSRSGVHTYLLIDDTTVYRYRCGQDPAAGPLDTDLPLADRPELAPLGDG
ncbi:signal peptidase I [Nakamurella endophytica]|uniref:Signal peptidase I n=1 Tax=Nakamurella endophytica TaxID=1748367 RepID=A0A917SW02_9ACTN|nr:signal peptidase I [Nakamurella endophytica]GGL99170.1 hypothetical protein GCM10011594_18950 [Nakamurella endophytica]